MFFNPKSKHSCITTPAKYLRYDAQRLTLTIATTDA